MKKICFVILLVLTLTGCKTAYEIVPDTIVDVPLKPTQPADEAAVQVTEPLTEVPTRPPAPEIPTHNGIPEESTPGTTEGAAQATEPAAVPPTDPPSYDPDGYVPNRLDRDVASAVNARREEAGLAPLTPDDRLCAIASVRAWESSVRWGHIRPDGRDGITVLEEYGYGYTCAAENMWFGIGAAGDIAGKWMGDPDARAVVLMEAAFIGVGSYTTAAGVTCVAVLIVG